ncbi:hypothetical protein BWK60_12210 [Flavobacterium covae]|uniref:Glycosyltransferase family 2 protein n=1 Tax=Flavobacterium columnare TaxID=996 RepID=A0AA94EYG8_9FLAO|nr:MULTISPECIES: glycosyltransferase family A protein [Flavobacterium]MCH4831112.1 glycosyltransferase family 2 protein [Flavobacterium columnare]MCH4832947.1 glycosyltransferase family 2 protein [Flavobacterium columnare]OWP85795.1 hypothetical protein BWK60_12210 [Flavobacterium covae]
MQKNTFLFSVIIPLYNKENYIYNTLISVINQTYTYFEIIIVNDGSTDKSLEIVKNINDSRIKIFEQNNKGVSSARNLGIKNATGSLIAFLDADDLWKKNHLEEIQQLYSLYPKCGMYCSRYFMKISKKKSIPISYSYEIPNDYKGILVDYFKTSLVYRVGLPSAVVIPKTLFKSGFSFNNNVSSGQDLELFTQIAISYPVAITNCYTIEYNFVIDNQLSKTPITQKKLCNLNQFNKAEENDSSLKQFLDVYRKEYSLHFKMAKDFKQAKDYYNKISSNNISWKFRILFHLPRIILLSLLISKRYLRSKGFDFTIYN